MGNAVGNLVDYWNAIESTNFFMGGAIWDWVDQAMEGTDSVTGKTYWGYGGDFGPDNKPNDGMFCMNGVMRPDLSPKAQYFEVKKVYQNVGVKAVDLKQGRIEIFNKNYFEPLKGYQVVWSLYKDGVCVEKDKPLMGAKNILGPRERQEYVLPYNYAQLDPNSEYFVKVQFLQGKDMPWAKKGYVQMEEQLRVKGADVKAPAIKSVAAKGTANVTVGSKQVSVKGHNYDINIDLSTGAISHLAYNGQEIIANGNGPKLDAFRAPTDNDAGIGYHNAWFKNGLYDLQHKVVGKPTIVKGKDGVTQISLTIESQGREGSQQVYSDRDRNPQTVYTFSQGKHALGADDFKFTTNQVYTIYPDGSVELQSAISANRTNVVLPRIGYSMKLPKQYNQFSYYGRGPVNNYADRKTGQFIELHQGEVGKQDIILPKPQSMGNREEVRYCALRPAQGGEGVAFVADSVMSVSALPWSQQQLTQAAHIYQLPESDGTYLHLDAKVTGLGGASCGQGGPFVEDQALSHNYNFGFIIRPLAAQQQLAEVAKVSPSGEQPISIEHSRTGMVTLSSPAKGRTIMYALGGSKKATAYTAPVNLRAGGTITTWYKDNPAMKTSMTYAKVESVPLQVVFASSQEPGSGDASYLVDGDPATIWHTMYSITLAKYPHWVDFDAAEPKLMKGFTFLPRQSGQNGWVKDYEVYVSQDGKSWGEPVCKGTFAANAELKRVMFSKPVKARYIRFRALNEQNGQDFASGAEFSLIAE